MSKPTALAIAITLLGGCVIDDVELSTSTHALLGGDGRIGQNPYSEYALRQVLRKRLIEGQAWSEILDAAELEDSVTWQKLNSARLMASDHPIGTAFPLIGMTVLKGGIGLFAEVMMNFTTWVILVPPGETPNKSQLLEVSSNAYDVGGVIACWNADAYRIEIFDAGLGYARRLCGEHLPNLAVGTPLTNDEYSLVVYAGVFPVPWGAGEPAPTADAVDLPQCADLGGQTLVPMRFYGNVWEGSM